MKIFESKRSFFNKVYSEAKVHSIKNVKREFTIIQWIKKLETEGIHYCMRDRHDKRVYSDMELKIALYLLKIRENASSSNLNRDLKTVENKCTVRDTITIISDQEILKYQAIDKEKSTRRHEMIEGREADLLFYVHRIIDFYNRKYDKYYLNKRFFFFFKVNRRKYLKKGIIKELRRSMFFNHEPL